MNHWFLVGMSVVLVGSSIALQLLRHLETQHVRRLLAGHPHYFSDKVNGNRRYGLWLSAGVFSVSVLLTPIKDFRLISPTTINVAISIVVFIYWFCQPKIVAFQHPLPSR